MKRRDARDFCINQKRCKTSYEEKISKLNKETTRALVAKYKLL
jgi:hypothetical protein